MRTRTKLVALFSVSFWVSGCVAANGSVPSNADTAPSSTPSAAQAPDSATQFPLLGDACSPAGEKFDFSRVRVSGRSEKIDEGARFAWPGVALGFHFRGTEFQIELDDSGRNWFGVEIDGVQVPGKLSAYVGPRCYLVAQKLTPGEHRLTLTRLTEAMLGETTFVRANAGKTGELLEPDPKPARRLEVIGDSISAAYGVEGESRACHFSPETENESLSYAAILGRHFGAEVSVVAWSGKGVFSNRGSTTDTIPMPVLWERTLPNREDSHWDFASWQPDGVVIDLGTNDFAQENHDKSPFAEAYRKFLFRVREVYPKAALFCAISPLLSDQWPPGENVRSTARAGIEKAIDALKARSDSRVFLVEHALETDAEGWGCDWHPSRAAQKRMADELTGPIAKNLGW
ncbi:MAG TPA: SGNH/GDSL hydrolase family protein [Polyangiaceae bacterium]